MPKKPTPHKGLTAPQQTNELQRLKQQAAAYVLDCNGRTLRDRSDVERNDDGTYHVHALIAAAAGKTRLAKLTDDEIEFCHRAADVLDPSTEGALLTVYDGLRAIEQTHGPAGLAAALDTMLEAWRHDADYWRWEATQRRPLTEADIRERIEREQERDHQYTAEASLQCVASCDSCDRVRRGGKWVKGPAQPNERTYVSHCPNHNEYRDT